MWVHLQTLARVMRQVRFTPERRTLTDAVHLSQAPRGAATLLAAEEL